MKWVRERIAAIVCAMIVILVAQSSASADFVGADVNIGYAFAAPDNIGWNQTQTIAAGGTTFFNVTSEFNVTVGASTITIDGFHRSDTWIDRYQGPVLTEITGGSAITGVAFDSSATNMAGLADADLSFDDSHVYLNWQGLAFDTSTIVTLDVSFFDPIHRQEMNGPSAAPLPAPVWTGLVLLGVVCTASWKAKQSARQL